MPARKRHGCCANCTAQLSESVDQPVELNVTSEALALCASIETYYASQGFPPTLGSATGPPSKTRLEAWAPDSWSSRARAWLVFCLLSQREHRLLDFYHQSANIGGDKTTRGARICVASHVLAEISAARRPVLVRFPGGAWAPGPPA